MAFSLEENHFCCALYFCIYMQAVLLKTFWYGKTGKRHFSVNAYYILYIVYILYACTLYCDCYFCKDWRKNRLLWSSQQAQSRDCFYIFVLVHYQIIH